jgi:hypothetical protein
MEATLAATIHTSLSAVRTMTTKPPEVINSQDAGQQLAFGLGVAAAGAQLPR